MISNFEIIFLILSYLLGSIPFGYLLTKYFAGKDILKMGSGNIGSTNVRRIAGKKLSISTQILDMLKGFLPVSIYLCITNEVNMQSEIYLLLLALASIVGHDFSIFLRFKGGKGVNTTLGASLLLAPIPVFISVSLYFLVKFQWKYVSLGSIILAISLPLTECFLHGFSFLVYYLLVCMSLIIILHRSNITRLLNHQELS